MARKYYRNYIPDVYIHDETLSVRYVLGNYGNKTLICIGINPNTANDKTSDDTMNDLINFSKKEGYDGCIMINPYPLICNSPSNLPSIFDKEICKRNLKHIEDVFNTCMDAEVLVSWGDYISMNKDFKEQVDEIIKLISSHNYRMIHINSLTKLGNPRHFRNLKRNPSFNKGEYEINTYDYLAY